MLLMLIGVILTLSFVYIYYNIRILSTYREYTTKHSMYVTVSPHTFHIRRKAIERWTEECFTFWHKTYNFEFDEMKEACRNISVVMYDQDHILMPWTDKGVDAVPEKIQANAVAYKEPKIIGIATMTFTYIRTSKRVSKHFKHELSHHILWACLPGTEGDDHHIIFKRVGLKDNA